jgi:hypothetical protein
MKGKMAPSPQTRAIPVEKLDFKIAPPVSMGPLEVVVEEPKPLTPRGEDEGLVIV